MIQLEINLKKLKRGVLLALGILAIIFLILISAAIVLQVLLYREKSESKLGIFIANMALALILAVIAFTSFPSNFVARKVIAVLFGALSIIALLVKTKFKQSNQASKIMLSIAVIAGCLQLFI